MEFFVIIPAHNEEERVVEVLTKVKKYTSNLVVVDDGSTDNTVKVATETGALVLKHLVNMGKGAALKTGCDFALQQGAERLVVIDADGQHEPEEIPNFLAALKDNDIVYSYRQAAETMPLVLKFGNWFINKTLNILCQTNLKDSQCGYRAFTSEAYRKIRWTARDYYMETEMIIKASKNNLKYSQIPIKTIYGDKYKGTTVIDGVKIVFKIIGGKLLR